MLLEWSTHTHTQSQLLLLLAQKEGEKGVEDKRKEKMMPLDASGITFKAGKREGPGRGST